MKPQRFAGILNAVAATQDGNQGNIYADATAKQTTLCLSKAVNPALVVPIGIPPIPHGSVNGYSYLASAAEVRQDCLVGYPAGTITAAMAEETILASTRYGIDIGNFQDRYETHSQNIGKYRFTSPATLTGTAALDRATVYNALAAKINAHLSNHVTAYPVYRIDYTTGDIADPVVGETILQATSLATGIIVALTTDIPWAGASVGTIWLSNVVGTWDATSKVTTCSGGGVFTTAAALTTGAGLHIRDDASYFAGIGRRGISQVMPAIGFTTALNRILIAGVYGIGQGTAMLADWPVFDPSGLNLISGKAENILNAKPVAGETYRTYIINCKATPPSEESLSGMSITKDIEIILYIEETTANEAAFEARLATELAK